MLLQLPAIHIMGQSILATSGGVEKNIFLMHFFRPENRRGLIEQSQSAAFSFSLLLEHFNLASKDILISHHCQTTITSANTAINYHPNNYHLFPGHPLYSVAWERGYVYSTSSFTYNYTMIYNGGINSEFQCNSSCTYCAEF